jgi:DNA-binding XRE family transcriptional regulator
MEYQDAIKSLRNKLLISQTELADMLGVSFASVNRWETGKYEPTLKVKRKLQKLFIENNIPMECKL